MSEEKSLEELAVLVAEKVSLAEDLLKTLSSVRHVDGVAKLEKKISHEMSFLRTHLKNSTIVENHILCTNLTHYEVVVAVLATCKSAKQFDFPLASGSRRTPLRVDIVCDKGMSWLKIFARKSKSIKDAASGQGKYGSKSILDHADEFLEVASENPINFRRPTIYFVCLHPLDDGLVSELQKKGIVVRNFTPGQEFSTEEAKQSHSLLNLDITTLLCHVSSQTNGSCYWEFHEAILTEQARSERKNPLKAILEKFFEGKRLICCETAAKSFREIVDLLGGPGEKERTEELMRRVEVLPDVTEIPEKWRNLQIRGKIKPRSFQIFIFGMFHNALTVTSNEGFIRAVKTQEGIEIPAYIHEARALTELKEKTAKRVSDPR
ncbi:UPF0415 protein C7orf25 homolog [Phlebotomus argentipes]|uniref:UPF0415 protein C7orf25 homolog n=1 Tax=Phlebotomus argentipes TaxID=94469 RepID=UPI0028929CC7|nr:UPF0415 protein C7orf25 homolog [Phlebotomus argentipes]